MMSYTYKFAVSAAQENIELSQLHLLHAGHAPLLARRCGPAGWIIFISTDALLVLRVCFQAIQYFLCFFPNHISFFRSGIIRLFAHI